MNNTLSKTLGLGLPALAEMIRAKGRGKDTILAHITPREAALLKKRGGAGTINPDTGLLEFQTEDDYYVPDEDSGPYIPEGTVYEPDPYYPEQAGPTYNELSYTPQQNYPEQAGPTYEEMGYTPSARQAEPNAPDYGDFGSTLYPLNEQGIPTQLTPEQAAATYPQLYPGGVLPPEGQETVFTPQGSPYYQNLTPISTAGAPKTKEQREKEKDYSNLLSQLLRLGLGAGTAYALSRGVQQPAAKRAEEQAQTAKNERMAIAAPYQGIGKGLIAGAQAGNLSASNIQAVKAARAMAAQNISRTGGVGVLQGANSIADLEARLLDNQLIQGIKIANIGDNYAINAIQAGMVADNALAASQADFAKQLGTLLAPMVLGYSPNLPSGLPGGGGQTPGIINTIADAGGNLLNSGGNAISSLSTQRGEV
tara:strand:- start:6506 stop:7774 length:1269 start_codon:yes stop_codon:yes gene_type:complete